MERGRNFSSRTSSVEETLDVARVLGGLVKPGDVIVLTGDLGAGKTALTKGLGAALGIEETITSPTFTLAREYHQGRLSLHHLDVYRLAGPDDAVDLALPELIDSGGVIVIEWGTIIASVLPENYLEVDIGLGDGDDDRVIRFMFHGTAWHDRYADLVNQLGVEVQAC